MKKSRWDGTLTVQVDEIDEDHRRLVELYEELERAVREGESQVLTGMLAAELVSCTDCHFRHEERLMYRYGYPGLEEHRREHQELMETARRLLEERQATGESISAEDVTFLDHWLTGHILGPDMDLGNWLNERA